MNTRRLAIPRPGRAVAAVGAVVAVSAATLMALIAGSAAAAPGGPVDLQPGKCIDTVNVRKEPNANSAIVALCDAGKVVQVGQTRTGFVELPDLGGWAAQQYISVNGRAPAPAPDRADQSGRVVPGQAGDSYRHGRLPHSPATTPAPAPAGSPLDATPLGGLLGG